MPLRKTKVVDGGYLSYGSGITCIASLDSEDRSGNPKYFASRRLNSPHYDATLGNLSSDLHASAVEVHTARRDPETRLGFLVTSHGLLPVWKTERPDEEPAEAARSAGVLLDDKSDAEVAEILGIDIEGDASGAEVSRSGTDGKRRLFLKAQPQGDGSVFCSGSGGGCLIEQLAASRSGAPRYFASQRLDASNYDPVLASLSKKLNELVEQAFLARHEPSARIGLLLTHLGLLPVWKSSEAQGQSDEDTGTDIDGKSDQQVADLLHLA